MDLEGFVKTFGIKLRIVRQASTLSNETLNSKEKNILHLEFVLSYIALFVSVLSLDIGSISVIDFFVNNSIALISLNFSLFSVYTYSIYTKYLYESKEKMQSKVLRTLGMEIFKKIFRMA